jgi:hypothetical protein
MSARVLFNGLDGASGKYLLPPLSDEQIGRAVLHLLTQPPQRPEEEEDAFRGLEAGIDPQRLSEAGWGLVMAEGADERFAKVHGRSRRTALGVLCRLREEEAGNLYAGDLVLRPGETAACFLRRRGARPEDPVDPCKVPYYLLLVGGPDEIPYSVQYELDLQYAVGRICFDTPEDYATYASAVVAAQEGRLRRRREVTFFAVENPGDDVTPRTTDELVRPLAASLAEWRTGWGVRTLAGVEASRARLASLLEGPQGPALLFTASHGVGFKCGHELQAELQGALVCQDWPGPHGAPLAREHYFGAPDLGCKAQVGGLVAFLFACYGAGTPRFDDFGREDDLGRPVEIAPKPLVSRLPQRLLSHPNGSALAVVGHVDRAWTHSFSDGTSSEPQIGVFKSLVRELLDGARLGAAMEDFGRRYGALAARVTRTWGAASEGISLDELGSVWRAQNDARNFVVCGDPAVQLAVGEVSY